ncbi:MAG: ABC transporter permease subunit [Armatimonadetes bacterium]|nr:ABC transporter permease subunit [Armatimonadota bacterium]
MLGTSSTALLFALPALIFFAGFVAYPIVHTCVLSFFSWSAVQSTALPVGLANYRALLSDPHFFVALRNNGLFIVLSVAVQMPLALLLALGLGSALRRHRLLRTLFFAPFVLPIVAVGLMWRLIYEPNLGALNALLEMVGRSHWARGWLGESEVAIFAVIAVSCWRYVGFHMMILLAGLQSIPADVHEAAALDGAGKWQTLWQVTLPMMRRVLLVDALLITVGSVRIFDLVKVMTDGGPGYASEVLATLMFRAAFVEDRMGYSAAIAVVMLLVTLVFTVVYLRLTRVEDVVWPPWVSRFSVWAVLLAAAAWVAWPMLLDDGAWPAIVGRMVALGLIAGSAWLLVHVWERLPRRPAAVVRDTAFALLAVLFILPVGWAVLGSVRTVNDLLLAPWRLPETWVWGNFAAAWAGGIGRYLMNSLAVTAFSVGLALAVSALSAYAFARLRVPGGLLLFGLIVGGILMPVHASLIPLYVQSRHLHLVNWPAIIGPYVAFGLPLMVLMLRAYLADIPTELSDAALIDGCGHWRVLWQVLLPIARPAVAAVAIFQASWVWNELPLALVLVRDRVWQVLPVGLLNFQGEHSADWGVIMAGVTLTMAPILALYFLFQRHIVSGLTAGAVR